MVVVEEGRKTALAEVALLQRAHVDHPDLAITERRLWRRHPHHARAVGAESAKRAGAEINRPAGFDVVDHRRGAVPDGEHLGLRAELARLAGRARSGVGEHAGDGARPGGRSGGGRRGRSDLGRPACSPTPDRARPA
ncbi:MAG: hypothetical protein EPO22_09990, partial [Dehalococcoidia bacterium]